MDYHMIEVAVPIVSGDAPVPVPYTNGIGVRKVKKETTQVIIHRTQHKLCDIGTWQG